MALGAAAAGDGVPVQIERVSGADLLAHSGFEAEWTELVEGDSSAHFNQSALWCLAWYRAYAGRFEPLVLAARQAGVLCGLAPLAVERATGRLLFAGDNLSDYRDVAGTSAGREAVLAALLDELRRRRAAVFRFGPMQPASPTAPLLCSLCAGRRLWVRTSSESAWHLAFSRERLDAIARKKWIRYSLNQYRREGPVVLRVLEDPSEWWTLRDALYDHHSLRQLHAGRRVSFHDPAKRALYDELVTSPHAAMSVAALYAGDRLLAEHCGYVWRGELAMGIPAFNTLEERRSPGLILLSLLFARLAAGGLRGVDFTPGPDPYKQRFASHLVELPVVDVYSRRSRHVAVQLRDRCRPWAQPIRHRIGRFLAGRRRDESPAEAGEPGVRRRRAIRVSPDPSTPAHGCVRAYDVRPPAGGTDVDLHTNELRPLLSWAASEARLRSLVRFLSEAAASGDAVHTATRQGRLLGWARTRLVDEPVHVAELGRDLDMGGRCCLVYGVAIVGSTDTRAVGWLASRAGWATGAARVVLLVPGDLRFEADPTVLQPAGTFEAARAR